MCSIKTEFANLSTTVLVNRINQPMLLSARRGQYFVAVSCCAHSEGGGVSIWQVRPLRVCMCASLTKQRPANGHPSQSNRKRNKKTGTTFISSVFAMNPTIYLQHLLWSCRSCRLSGRRPQKPNQELMHLAPRCSLFWPGKVPRSDWLASFANIAISGSSQHLRR